jgi:protein-S-isoprenylcysteine O-methyltransferase Ste14
VNKIDTEKTWMDNARAKVQWWRAPIMTALILIGIYYITSETLWLWIGMGSTLLGEFIQLWAASHLRKDMSLATSGPYSHVRNPMYFGRFFVLLGFVLMIQGAQPKLWVVGIPVLLVIYVIGFVWYVYARVGREEARLRGIFGKPYEDYCKEVRRFLPRLRPYSGAAPEKWQWSKLANNHEYLNLIAVIVVFAVILVRIKYYGGS